MIQVRKQEVLAELTNELSDEQLRGMFRKFLLVNPHESEGAKAFKIITISRLSIN